METEEKKTNRVKVHFKNIWLSTLIVGGFALSQSIENFGRKINKKIECDSKVLFVRRGTFKWKVKKPCWSLVSIVTTLIFAHKINIFPSQDDRWSTVKMQFKQTLKKICFVEGPMKMFRHYCRHLRLSTQRRHWWKSFEKKQQVFKFGRRRKLWSD